MRDFNTEFGYRPYTGGAGPSKEDMVNATAALYCALFSVGMQPRIECEDDGSDDGILVVTVGSRRVSYDRWGYCNADGNPETEIDQVDLNGAVAYFQEAYHV